MRLVSAKIEMVKMMKAMTAGSRTGGLQVGQAEAAVLPERKKQPAVVGLVLDDLAEVEFAEIEQHRNDREAERDFVGNHLRGGAHAADERVFRVGRPAGQGDAINGERGDGENEQRADIEIRDDEFSRCGRTA
jgi:hypothetical protein